MKKADSRRSVALLAACGFVVLAGCGDDGGDNGIDEPGSGAYDDPAAMAAALGCSDSFEDLGPATDETTGVVAQSGECTLEGQAVTLEVIVDPGDATVDEAMAAALEAVCQFGTGEYFFAQGPGWFATGEDPTNSEMPATLADLLGGEAKTLSC